MASQTEVETAGKSLRDGLYRAMSDGRFVAERQVLRTLHLLISQSLQDYSLSPAGTSEQRDAAVTALTAAQASLAQLAPGDGPSLQHLVRSVGAAADALDAITGASSPHRAFQGALAVRRRPASTASGSAGLAEVREAGGAEPDEPFLTSLAKLFPAEALSALLLVLSIDEKYELLRNVLIGMIAAALLVIRYFATRDPQSGKPDWLAIFVSFVSFLIYAAAMLAFGVLFGTDEPTTRIVATVVAILWMAILTAVVRKTPPPS